MKRKFWAMFLVLLLLPTVVLAAGPQRARAPLPLEEDATGLVETKLGNVALDATALDAVRAQAGKNAVTVFITEIDGEKLPKNLATRPAYDIALTVGDTVATLGEGHITVSIPYALGAGENPEHIVAAGLDASGRVTPVIGSAWQKGYVRIPNVGLGKYVILHNPNAFLDVAGHWGEAEIAFSATRGLLLGMTADTFEPERITTWAMAVTVLGRLAGVDATGNTGPFYAPYVLWAQENEMLPETFRPDEMIRRESLAGLLTKYLRLTGEDPADYRVPPLTYTDRNQIDPIHWMDVAFTTRLGLLNGRTDGTFDPQAGLTRAELSAVVYRLIQWPGEISL